MPDKSRNLWLVLCVVGVVVAIAAGVAQLAGGDPEDDRAVRTSSSSSEPTSGATSTSSPAAPRSTSAADGESASATGSATASVTDQITPPKAWPKVDLPAVPPARVVDTFLDAVLAADCKKADQQLTPGFKQQHGNCSTSGLVPKDVDDYEAEVEEAEPDKQRPMVTVPATLTYAGQDSVYEFELIIVDGKWKIRDVEQ